MRDVNKPRNADARGDLGDTFSSLYMNIVKGEVSFVHGPQGQHGKSRNAIGNILGFIVAADEVVHDIGVPDTLGDLLLVTYVPFLPKATAIRVNKIKGRADDGWAKRTRETICPRSPVTFKWRFSSSSRYGMTTCVPAFAVCMCEISCLIALLRRKKKHTELGNEIAAEEARATKDGRDVTCYRTAP